ncbi:MAG: hypothetical protein ABIJ96_02055 [Elusimicrobiota bacterium]
MVDKKVLNSILPHILREAGRLDRKAMKKGKLYWIFHRTKKKAYGPYNAAGLAELTFFRPESRIAPYESMSRDDWKPAKDYPELRSYLTDKK